MLSYFPPPYPDELFHSLCARFIKRTGFSNTFVHKVLLGSQKGGPSIEFPGRLTHFADQLRWTGIYHEEDVIRKHSLLPVYLPFLKRETQTKVKESMYQDKSHRAHYLVGNTAKAITKIEKLRFCSKCVDSDREKYGEAYWHRTHQIRGVLTCPIHNVFLQSSLEMSLDRYAYLDADDNTNRKTEAMDTSVDNPIFHLISKDAAWLLDNSEEEWDLDQIRLGYTYLLRKQNLMHRRGGIKSLESLNQNFTKAYSQNILPHIQRVTGGGKLFSLTKLYKVSGTAQYPIHHLLFIRYLGLSIAEFHQLVTSLSGQEENSNIGHVGKHNKNAIEKNIRKFWNNPSISLREIGRIVDIDHKTVKDIAIRLGLPYPRKALLHEEVRKQKQLFQRKLSEKRAEWLRKTKQSSVKKSGLDSGLQKWLATYDKKWLSLHQANKITLGRPSKKDDHNKDQELAAKIPLAATEIMQQPGKPVRAIRFRILRQINMYNYYNRHRNELPLTLKALSKYSESAHHFALRKIAWNKIYLVEKNIYRSRAVLFDRLKLSKLRDNAAILSAFEELWIEVRKLRP